MTHPPYLILDKKRGQTPLAAVRAWQEEHPDLAMLPATYAGRLDPMAEGKLLVLLGEECRKKDEYSGLDKEYEIEVVLGIGTDTGDALGLPTVAKDVDDASSPAVAQALSIVLGSHTIPYPPFSSKTVAGTPLFMYALAGTLDSIDIPTHEETIYRIDQLARETMHAEDLQTRVEAILADIPAADEAAKETGMDFRQDEIRAAWEAAWKKISAQEFPVLRLRVACGTGTYMRTLASRIAQELGTQGFCLSIRRTKIGRYRQSGPLGFWQREY